MIQYLSLTFRQQKAFTIVELLIVIVVIAILAAISLVAYNGIQNRAQDAVIQSNSNAIRKAIEMYSSENGEYPVCSAGDGHSCVLSSISTQLVPKYVSVLPNDTTYPYQFVATNTSAHGYRWSVRIYKKSAATYCQIGVNYYPSWWSSSPAC